MVTKRWEGLVNIITRKSDGEHHGFEGAAGNFAGKSFYGFISHEAGHWQVYQSGKLFTTNNYRDHNRNNQGQLFGHATYTYDSGDISLSYAFLRQYQLFAGALDLQQVETNPEQSQNQSDFGRMDTTWIHLQHHQDISSHWQIVTNVLERHDEGDFIIDGLSFHQSRNNFFLQPEIRGRYQYLDWLGGVSETVDQYAMSIDHTQAESQQHDFFGQVTMKFTPAWRLILGSRAAEQNSNILTANLPLDIHNQVLVSSQALEHDLSSHLMWFIRRDGNFRFPKVDEQTFTPSNVIGLKTQTGVSYETGFRYQDSKWRGQINFFQLDLNNEIAFDPTTSPLQPFGANQNLDPTRRQGLMVGGMIQCTDKLFGGANLTYINARFRSGEFQGNRIPFVAGLTSEVSMTYHIKPQWFIFGEAIHMSRRFPLNDDANSGNQEPPLTVFNLSTRYALGHFYIQGRINNLTNHFYNAVATLQSDSAEASFYPAMGRSFWVTLGWKG